MTDPAAEHLAGLVVGPLVLVEVERLTASMATLLAAHHLLCTWRRPDAFLVVAGEPGRTDPMTATSLQRYVDGLNLTRVWLNPDPTSPERRAFRTQALIRLAWNDDLAAAPADVVADALFELIRTRAGG